MPNKGSGLRLDIVDFCCKFVAHVCLISKVSGWTKWLVENY